MALGGVQALAGEEVARVLVSQSERIAVDAVARLELSLEVDGPQIVL
jgi:hypothetical protein